MALDAMLKKAMQTVDPPAGLIARARDKIESESRPQPGRFLSVSWKTAVPALLKVVFRWSFLWRFLTNLSLTL